LAISQSDAKRIASVKGIGKKTAERIVVELKDKVNPIEALAASSAATSKEQGAVLRDAMLALAALGFGEDAARKMVSDVLESDPGVNDTETVIKRALGGRK
jgi:Holliday junction DNA helicase RuvA